MQVGIIGLGLVGNAIARRLTAAGYVVHGYDIVVDACKRAEDIGVQVQSTDSGVAKNTKTILLCLMTSEDRRSLLWGEQHLSSALQPDSILLDVSTSRPEDIVKDGHRLAAQQARLIDVCLSGSSEVIANGQALALIGDKEENASYRDLLATFSKAQYFFDQLGAGNRMKLIVNMAFGLNRLVLAETLGMAAKAGFDLNTVLEVLKSGETYSTCMDTKGPKMVDRVFEPPVARLAQHAKDVGLILELARELDAYTPVSELHEQALNKLIAAGFGDLDNAAIFKAYE